MSEFIRSNAETDWIDNMVEHGGDKLVITFIGDILFHSGENVNKIESIRNLFENGYCYYFAKMLEDAFPGGIICICYPYGHIIYLYNEVPYDISGVSYAEYEELIPLKAFGDGINDFKHVDGKSYGLTYEEREYMKNKWIETHGRIIIK